MAARGFLWGGIAEPGGSDGWSKTGGPRCCDLYSKELFLISRTNGSFELGVGIFFDEEAKEVAALEEGDFDVLLTALTTACGALLMEPARRCVF